MVPSTSDQRRRTTPRCGTADAAGRRPSGYCASGSYHGLPLQVGDLGLGAEILEQLRAARRVATAATTAALGIVQVAEDDRPGRAAPARRPAGSRRPSARASRPWPSIFAALIRCTQNVHFSITPTSRTETSGFSCRWSGFSHCGLKKLKNRTLYGQALRAVARADAAVVDLRVQPFLGVMAGVGRAHRLARRVVALLAQHRPELHPHVRELALPVALDAQPVHGAAARRLVGADRRDVVLGVAGRHAGLAARAAVQIDDHAPSMWHRRSLVKPAEG